MEFLVDVGPSHRQALENVQSFIKDTRSQSTSKTYAAAQRKYVGYCEARGWTPYPSPEEGMTTAVQLASYAQHMATEDKSAATISTTLSAIGNEFMLLHNIAGTTSQPLVKQAARAAAIATSNKKSNQKLPIQKHHLKLMEAQALKELANSTSKKAELTVTRDLALIFTIYYAALRRSEAVQLKESDLTWHESNTEGRSTVTISIRKSKTNQSEESKQQSAFIMEATEACPVRWLIRYLCHNSKEGEDQYLFTSTDGLNKPLSATTIAHIVKRHAAKIGLDPSKYSSHSMRRGAATDAAALGVDMDDLRAHGRWAPGSQVVHKYISKSKDDELTVAKALVNK
jgi:site-specific recombinase XerD